MRGHGGVSRRAGTEGGAPASPFGHFAQPYLAISGNHGFFSSLFLSLSSLSSCFLVTHKRKFVDGHDAGPIGDRKVLAVKGEAHGCDPVLCGVGQSESRGTSLSA